jgi:hypothetical protein
VIAACLAPAVIGVTTAAGAFAASKHKAPADQATYSATFIKLPTGVSFEDAPY